jgi:hypothetical protein
MPQGIKTQGFRVNPGAQQVTSKGSTPGLGKGGHGKGSTSSTQGVPQPQNGKYSPKNAGTQQLSPGRHPKRAYDADYAQDAKTYGTGGNKTLRNPAKSSAFPLNKASYGR